MAALAALFAAVLLSGCASVRGPGGRAGVVLHETNDVIRVEFDGKPFTEYHFRDVSRPFLYPIFSADGDHYTRRWPLEDAPGEEHDHPHHKGLWWAHGAANGVDFWSESDKAGRTVHQSFAALESGMEKGVLTSRNRWIAKDGSVVASDERTMVFHRPHGNERIIDFSVTVFASNGELVLGDTKEGTMAIRVAESMRVAQPKGKPGEGHMVNSAGVKDAAVWGKHAEWIDYYGPVNGRTLGVAIFDHPSNPRHPTTWHARDYGLFAVNPFGLHDFESKPAGAGDMKIPAGSSVTFRYRFYFHPGDTESAGVKAAWADYARGR
jgi:Methane oxygenase PmoA